MPSLYTTHTPPLATLYGTLDGQVRAGAPVFAGTAGSVVERSNKQGFRFHARRYYDGDGKQREVYVAGPVGNAEADAAAERLREWVAEVKAMTADLRLLGREGFQLADSRSYATLASLHLHGLFQAGAVLVGSHAFGVLLNQLGIRAAAYATEDIDIARHEALALPSVTERSFLDMLRESGIPFVEVPQLDAREPSTSFKQRGRSRFHVDLLVPSSDDGFPVVAVPELQAHATGLPYLAYLLGATQFATLLSREGACPVRVPQPPRFAMHKLLVSQLRGGAKGDKDRFQAGVLLAAIGEAQSGAIAEAFDKLPRSARSAVRKALRLVEPVLADDHARAWEECAELLAG
jgi:hypothetical protein